jgi:hypothetical protein
MPTRLQDMQWAGSPGFRSGSSYQQEGERGTRATQTCHLMRPGGDASANISLISLKLSPFIIPSIIPDLLSLFLYNP